MNIKHILVAALLWGGHNAATAQGEYAEIARLRSMNEGVYGIRSTADGEHYTTLEGNQILRYSYAAATPGEKLLPAAAAELRITGYALSPDERRILLSSGRTPIYRHSFTTSYHLVEGQTVRQVLREAEAPRDATFSPDGQKIAYS
ncbi:MAG: DPP IV N-terminal domain-containing protein, partial [Alistipes sp.]|nr:DPP IV N-terminal domain-containing protein [Alistipes sp.]